MGDSSAPKSDSQRYAGCQCPYHRAEANSEPSMEQRAEAVPETNAPESGTGAVNSSGPARAIEPIDAATKESPSGG